MRLFLIFLVVGVGYALDDSLATYIGIVHPTGTRLMSKDATRFPERLTMTLSVNEKPLKLVKTEHLFALSYRAERRGLNDTLHSIVHAGPPSENCYYHAEDPEEMAAVSLCNGVQGLWWIGDYRKQKDRVLWIEPDRTVLESPIKIQDVQSHMHRVTDVTEADLEQDLRCGIGDVGLFAHELHHRAFEHPTEQATSPRQIRVLLINDNARFKREGSHVESATINLFNAVKEVYRKANLIPHLTLSLAGQLTFIERDPFKPAMRGSEALVFGSTGLLDKWNDYRSSMAARLPVHDHGQLLSGANFESRISGLAGVGTLCSPSISGSITQLTYGQLSNVVIMAHELGHGLGMRHDGSGNTCPKSGFIMQPTIGSSLDFSSCSLGDCSGFVQRSGQFCLPLAPAAVDEGAAPVVPNVPVSTSAIEAAKNTAKTLACLAREHVGAIVGTSLGIPLGTYLLWRIFKNKGLPLPSLPKFLKRRGTDKEQPAPAPTKKEKSTVGKSKTVKTSEVNPRSVPVVEQTEFETEPSPAPAPSGRRSSVQHPHKFTEQPSIPSASTRIYTTTQPSPTPLSSAAAGGRPLATVGNRKAKDTLDDDEDLQVWQGDDIPSAVTKPVQTSEPRTTATKWLDAR